MAVDAESSARATAASQERRAATFALVAGIAIMATKFVAWRLTGSSAVYSDAVESIVNVVAGAFALWAIAQSHRPADRTHPYGHGRFEFLSATVEAALDKAADMPAEVRELLLIRVAASRNSTAKYKRLIQATSSDGRLRGLLQFCGASRTGRWAGRTFQPQNLQRVPKYVAFAMLHHY
jgi:hypothetical protein